MSSYDNHADEPEISKGWGKLFRSVFWGTTQKRAWIQTVHMAVLFLIFTMIWFAYGNSIKNNPRYFVGHRNIIILSPPTWISPHFVNEVLAERQRQVGTGLNINDPKLVDELCLAFAAHPWVRRVKWIEIKYPAQIIVSLEFRAPQAMVEVPTGRYGPNYKGGVFQIDADGVLLPTDYLMAKIEDDPNSVYEMLWIAGVQSTPMGAAGEPWNDPLISQAALLAEFLSGDFKKLGLRKIVLPAHAESDLEASFELETTRGAKIHWGTFPVSAVVAARSLPDAYERYERIKKEAFDAQQFKIERLKGLVQKYGSLDDLPADLTPPDVSEP